MFSSDPNQPNYCRPETKLYAEDLELITDLLGGTSQMHRKSKKWIRKWKDEDTATYNIRRTIEEVFEGFSRTLSASVGMLFAKPPQVTWNAAEVQVKPHFDNVDCEGTKWHVFAKRFSDNCLRDGFGVLLTDHPSPPIDPVTEQPVVVTSANEIKFNLRPRWASYPRQNVINWKTGIVNNQRVLTLLVLYEPGEDIDGTYGVKPVHRYRHLNLRDGAASWTLYERHEENGKETFPSTTGEFRNRSGDIADFLPVSIAYTGRTNETAVASIPLVGVAWANLGHWRQSSNLRFYREVAAFPGLKLKGKLQSQKHGDKIIPGTVKLGPLVCSALEQEADLSWLELAGTSLDQVEKGIAEKLKQMAQMGVSFLFGDKRSAETAEAKRLDATAEQATLSTAAQGIEDALNSSCEHFGWFMGIEKKDCPVVTISRDFESVNMDPQTMAVYVKAVVDAGLPARLMLSAWQQGGRIPADEDLDKLEMEMMANAQSIADEKAREAEERAAAMSDNPLEEAA